MKSFDNGRALSTSPRMSRWRIRPLAVFAALFAALCALALAGCESGAAGLSAGEIAARVAMRNSIAAEAPGDYWVGRRYYNANYKFWGYVRKPGQPWGTAQLVVMHESAKLNPDRVISQLGIDNNSEYRIRGGFTGQQVYEPASNRFYPEFRATNFDLVNSNPPSIFPPGFRASPTEIQNPER